MPETRSPYGSARQARDGRIAVRTTSEERELIAQASRVAETTMSDFVLRASIERAEDVLAERREFRLSQDQWEALVAMLDRPLVEKPHLRRLVTTPSVLDS